MKTELEAKNDEAIDLHNQLQALMSVNDENEEKFQNRVNNLKKDYDDRIVALTIEIQNLSRLN